MTESPAKVVAEVRNPWDNAYWFARWLIATEHGSLANDANVMNTLPIVINVINVTDKLGIRGCMEVERAEVVEQFGILRRHVNELPLPNQDIILTAFCQEFERKVANARKSRAGQSLESVTSLIMDYYHIDASTGPEHFTAALEIDRWVRTKDGWLIGISCKRTLRERWKQAYTDNIDLLNKFKIRALWHVLTFDHDLSDDKLTEMGSHRATFYLPDDSARLASASSHVGMRNYVRPMTQFVDDLRREIKGLRVSELRRTAEGWERSEGQRE